MPRCYGYDGRLSQSKTTTTVAEAAWIGLRNDDGSLLRPGLEYQTYLTGPRSNAGTTCAANGTCAGRTSPLVAPWMKLFVEKDPNFNLDNMTRQEYERIFRQSGREHNGFIGTNSPDLQGFCKAGGKDYNLSWPGKAAAFLPIRIYCLYLHIPSAPLQADEIIPFGNSRRYHDPVATLDPHVHDLYGLFRAPAVMHCYGGIGGYPSGIFNALVNWVENGVAPESLEAKSPTNRTTLLCPYPKKAIFQGSNAIYGAENTCV